MVNYFHGEQTTEGKITGSQVHEGLNTNPFQFLLSACVLSLIHKLCTSASGCLDRVES